MASLLLEAQGHSRAKGQVAGNRDKRWCHASFDDKHGKVVPQAGAAHQFS